LGNERCSMNSNVNEVFESVGKWRFSMAA
jgi:hypothetical protein